MRKLTKVQSDVVKKMADREWYTAYDLQCKISTLNALYEKSLLSRQSPMGSYFCPRTIVKFSLSVEIETIQNRLVEILEK